MIQPGVEISMKLLVQNIGFEAAVKILYQDNSHALHQKKEAHKIVT